MGERKRIGLIYFYKIWIGGKTYIQNLILSLNMLDDRDKPIIDLYCMNEDAFYEVRDNTKYPYLEMIIVKPQSNSKLILRKLISFFSKRVSYRINMFKINPKDMIVYPYFVGSHVDKFVHWIPDLQEKHLPELFDSKEVKNREKTIREVCEKGVPIVFSSYDSQKDFYTFFPEYNSHPTYVVHFAVYQQDFSTIDVHELRQKYNINKNYFLCANQFWVHKNHLFLFRAFKKAVESGLDMQLVCTGSFYDNRNPLYINEIRAFIKENNLETRILLLGVINKLELLALMKNSYAVIQPSLFEGWNTTVEDCKAMSKFVFLSDLRVHREQIKENACFFDPKDVDDLTDKLLNVVPNETQIDYSVSQKEFCRGFYDIIKSKY